MMRSRVLSLLEVLLVYGGLIALWRVSEQTGLAAWDERLFGYGSGLKIAVIVVLPIIVLKLVGRSLGGYGIQFDRWRRDLRMAMMALFFLSPLFLAFPILVRKHVSLTGPVAAPVLSLVFLIGLVLLGWAFRKKAFEPERHASATRLIVFLIILAILLILSAWMWPGKKLLPRITYLLLATGFGEEIFFRGYVQSRLNEGFGRPFCTWNTHWGWGLVITAVLFGIIHAFNPIGTVWWSVWTVFAGLLFGFLREKTGSIVAPAIVHGLPLTIAGMIL